MTIEYTIEEADFLTHQLYIASRSERIKRKRKRSRLLVPIAYLVIGLYFYLQQQQNLGYAFFLIGILWFFFYPLWDGGTTVSIIKRSLKKIIKKDSAEAPSWKFPMVISLPGITGMKAKCSHPNWRR